MTHRRLRSVVGPEQDALRLEEYLSLHLSGLRRGALRGLIRAGRVRVNGREGAPGMLVHTGDHVEAAPAPAQLRGAPRLPAKIRILHEDDAVIVVDKPAGLTVTAERGAPDSPLLAALSRQLGPRGVDRPRVVHRLDRDTSGVVVLAKSLEAARHLGRQWLRGEVRKIYMAVAHGEPAEPSGVIETRLRPESPGTARMVVCRKGGKSAVTRYEVSERFRGFSLLTVCPETGRMHQIRLHLAHLGHPLVGDGLYGGEAFYLSLHKASYKRSRGTVERPLMGRQALHALEVTFQSPATSGTVTVNSPLPKDFHALVEVMRRFLPR